MSIGALNKMRGKCSMCNDKGNTYIYRMVIDISSFYGAQLCRCLLPTSPEDGNRSSFRNVLFLLPRIPDDGKVQNTSNSVCYTPSSETFKI
jgi:hypothetical protein